jgi:hypothetical protein
LKIFFCEDVACLVCNQPALLAGPPLGIIQSGVNAQWRLATKLWPFIKQVLQSCKAQEMPTSTIVIKGNIRVIMLHCCLVGDSENLGTSFQAFACMVLSFCFMAHFKVAMVADYYV